MASPILNRLEKHLKFRSRFLPDERDLLVYLPEEYGRFPFRRYPVLYLQDGQNLFDPETSFVPGKHWRVGETADDWIRRGLVQPLIIVGIHHAGPRRIQEYTPTEDGRRGGGGAELYGRMLVGEIKPFIDSAYRTIKRSARTGLGGSSLGGLVSLFLGLSYPHIFGRLAVLSPSLWWHRRSMLRIVAAAPAARRARIWLDIGGREAAGAVRDAKRLRGILERKGWCRNRDLAFRCYPQAGHDESAWAERFGPMLQFLYPSRSGHAGSRAAIRAGEGDLQSAE